MLLTNYLVGRKKVGDEDNVLCLVVDSVLPPDLSAGRAEIIPKVARQDLILELVSDDKPVEWLNFADLPLDVIALLATGAPIPVIDVSDNSFVMAQITQDGPSGLAADG